MPIYEYRCGDCGTEFEVTQSMDAKPLKKCEKCSGSVERLISFTSFTLKGSGWYSDGYSTAKGSQGSSDTASPKTEKTQKTEKKAEKKSDKSGSACATTTLGKSD
ncbi:MAG: zinc ribbon domain-containing protein [bacterium]|nr:zinc ribbon domain-containing protein [bacterium]